MHLRVLGMYIRAQKGLFIQTTSVERLLAVTCSGDSGPTIHHSIA